MVSTISIFKLFLGSFDTKWKVSNDKVIKGLDLAPPDTVNVRSVLEIFVKPLRNQ